MNIVVLLGGVSPERNISLLSGRAFTFALRERGHSVVAVDPSLGSNGVLSDEELRAATAQEVTEEALSKFEPRKLMECIESALFDNVDVVFIGLHGRYGEDGYIQSLLDLRGIPYTGSGMLASAIAMDKATSKLLFAMAGIPSAHWVTVDPKDADNETLLMEVLQEIRGTLVVKPNDQGSTVGMTILENPSVESLREAVLLVGRFSKLALIERYIAGRELTVPVLGGEALPIIEIIPHAGFYDYANKYTKGRTDYECPATLSEEVQHHVQNLAVAAHGILGCRAYSRVDFRLNEENMPFCLEVNTLPGCTETSLVPMSARQAGIEFGDLLEEIIRLSLEG